MKILPNRNKLSKINSYYLNKKKLNYRKPKKYFFYSREKKKKMQIKTSKQQKSNKREIITITLPQTNIPPINPQQFLEFKEDILSFISHQLFQHLKTGNSNFFYQLIAEKVEELCRNQLQKELYLSILQFLAFSGFF